MRGPEDEETVMGMGEDIGMRKKADHDLDRQDDEAG